MRERLAAKYPPLDDQHTGLTPEELQRLRAQLIDDTVDRLNDIDGLYNFIASRPRGASVCMTGHSMDHYKAVL